ncbi:hypothetical protein UVI_02063620 [Ustilaginoidea virens]|uniref:Major facilitator superfamily (MFS) profile domain-containing protein n=1 Tax=Ustilaginoidea virens TaxID=1159556 RepID=A0A1B5L6H7_USTVR|nr:hypothetical protein UVI_02063620 [Ustilaginoidea virens]
MAPYLGLRGSALSRAFIGLVVLPAFFCYGYNLSVAGGLLTLDSFVQAFPQLDTINTVGEELRRNSTIQGNYISPRSIRPQDNIATGTVVALFTVGGMLGSLSCVYLGDKLGRRRVIFVASATTAIGAALMALSFSLAQLITARIVLGIGTGGYVATVPVWQSEISKPSKRGAHVVTNGIFLGAGASVALWIALGFYFVKGTTLSWRFPLGFQIILLVITMVFVCVLPESPRWLVKQGRHDEARAILAALGDVDPDHDAITQEIRDIRLSLSVCGTMSWKTMFSMGNQRMLHRTALAAAGQMFQQLCGINLITMYATTILEQHLGMGPVKSRALAASMCMTQPLGGFFAFFTIDRLGRRRLMLWSAAGMAACMAVLSGTTSARDNAVALLVAIVFLFAFQFIFTVGYSGLTFLYAAEIAPLPLRAAISAVSTAVVWVFNFLLAEVTPVGFNTIGSRFYVVFAMLNAAIVPTVYLFFPETSGRSLEEIDDIFTRSKSIWDPPRVAKSVQSSPEGGASLDKDESIGQAAA